MASPCGGSIVLIKTSRFSVFEIGKVSVKSAFSSAPKINQNQKSKLKKEKNKLVEETILLTYVLVDIDANLLHESIINDINEIRLKAYSDGIKHMIVPGCTLIESKKSLELSHQSLLEKKTNDHDEKNKLSQVYSTVGIHPYSVPQLENLEKSMNDIENLIIDNIDSHLIKAIGETGLDNTDSFPSIQQQIPYFELHVKLAIKYNLPLFLHQRGAFHEFCDILKKYNLHLNNDSDDIDSKNGDDIDSKHGNQCQVVIHCFTGNRKELEEYVSYGFYIGITGYILRKDDTNVNELLSALSDGIVPLHLLMIETDAPYMGFKGCRKGFKSPTRKFPNVPSSLITILTVLSEVLKISPEKLAQITTENANRFFKLF